MTKQEDATIIFTVDDAIRMGYLRPVAEEESRAGSKPVDDRLLLGRLVMSPGAAAALETAGQSPGEFLDRHRRQDWGDVPAEDKAANDQAMGSDGMLLSAYRTKRGDRLWIISDAGRLVTTLLLPKEY